MDQLSLTEAPRREPDRDPHEDPIRALFEEHSYDIWPASFTSREEVLAWLTTYTRDA